MSSVERTIAELGQVRQRGIARTEIVDGDLESDGAQLSEHRHAARTV
jgi:hypothetical protein